jgi:hypothetical protein
MFWIKYDSQIKTAILCLVCNFQEGTRWNRWLRRYATSQKAADSSPDDFIEFVSIYVILPAALDPGVY